MKRIALMITAMTTGVLMMTGGTFADEMIRTTIEGSQHVTTTPADPVAAPPLVQERSYQRTERQSSTVTPDPVPPPSVQERRSDSYRTEEQSSSTDPLNPQEKTTTHSRVEERSSRTVPSPEVQQRTTIERRSSTVTAE